MAAPCAERLFSLELLVDWVRLEAGPPPPPPVVVEEEEEEEGEEEAFSRSLCPAVAFRLLDFPTLLVYPPGGPATAAAPDPRPGLLSFGRGKSCLFRLPPATLRGRLLATPLYALLLRLPPGRPTPAPRLLGTCSVSLAAAALKVLGPAASCCSHGQRGSFPLHNHEGERVGHMALTYRLTDLGSSLLGHLERRRPVASHGGCGGPGGEGWGRAVEGSGPAQQEKQLPQTHSDPVPRDPEGPPKSLNSRGAPRDVKEVVSHKQANPGNAGSLEKGASKSVCPHASGGGKMGPRDQEGADLDMETNTFCPPPLYYTHVAPAKRPPLLRGGQVTIQPQGNVSEEPDGPFPEEKPVTPATYTRLLKHTDSAAGETPAVLNPPPPQDVEAGRPSRDHPQTEPNRLNTIRQLPLLNALLVELSLLYNQPVSSPTNIHPHLAWLYRSEDKKSPESSARSTAKSESKEERLSVGNSEPPGRLQYKKHRDEKLKKGHCFEKNQGAPSKKAPPRGKLLYGLTNTLKLRLKQTNPGMLVVHERREQYRKMQVQMFSAKPRIPSSKAKVLSFAGQHREPPPLPKDQGVASDTSLTENGDSSKLMGGVSGDPSTTQERQLKRAAETKVEVDRGENRTSHGSREEMVSPANAIVPERWAQSNILEGHVDVGVQSPFTFQQVAVVDKLVTEKSLEDRTTGKDILTADVNERQPSKESCSESISEPKYSDDFTSPCYSEDFCTDDSSRILQAQERSPSAGNPNSKSSGTTRWSLRKNGREQSCVPTPPFSAGSPVRSAKRFHVSKTRDESLEEASTLSTSDLSSCWTEEKENQLDGDGVHPSKATKTGQDTARKARTGCRSLEKSQSIRTSQVSSYLPSNLSECSKSDHFEEDSDEIASLNISEQCKDISELLVNKLPGYTV